MCKYEYPQNLATVMWDSYAASEFLPIVGVKKITLHQWGRRENIGLPPTGRGKKLELTGHKIVFLAALSTLSTLEQPPSSGKFGLEREVGIFTECFVREFTNFPYRYCVAKTRPLGHGFMEWELSDTSNPANHIVDSVGGAIVPGWIVLDLMAITEKVARGLYEIRNR